jgi:hypothetical protein
MHEQALLVEGVDAVAVRSAQLVDDPDLMAHMVNWTGEELVMPTFLAAPHVRHAAARLMRLQPASEHPAERPGPLPPGHGRDRPSPGPGPAGVARRSPTGRGRPRHPARATCRDSRRRGRPPRRRMEPRDRARRRSHRGLGEMLRIRRVAADDLDLVASRDDAGSDAAAHVACTHDRHACHGAASSGSCRAHQLPCRHRYSQTVPPGHYGAGAQRRSSRRPGRSFSPRRDHGTNPGPGAG